MVSDEFIELKQRIKKDLKFDKVITMIAGGFMIITSFGYAIRAFSEAMFLISITWFLIFYNSYLITEREQKIVEVGR